MNTNEADQAKREEYHRYLNSPEWQVVRSRCLSKAGFQCSVCESKTDLQAHHLTYKNIFHEADEDLMALCRRHHELIESFIKHGKMRRHGDTKRLRRTTLRMIRRSEMAKKIRPKGSPVRNRIQEKLLAEPWFRDALMLRRKPFKRLIRSKLYSFSNFGPISSNACTLYKRLHKLTLRENL